MLKAKFTLSKKSKKQRKFNCNSTMKGLTRNHLLYDLSFQNLKKNNINYLKNQSLITKVKIFNLFFKIVINY